ncbi:hypothetical protein [Laspinema olomoucense]|uniref:Uncharacterized protein n=1 Tax=Laspinema olomoucense D3b TaxID=2953688 RepID=A0ABT2NA97_9CYAN|nr:MULTISPECIES: hypothetical protein [unclassified Laspinema]MCT7975994.1 hypothetical protein [Laspinema sp. D3d]MCT7978645.1 hypothetical protein [Laspinema sp. D3b]MCT7987124.1 hypothetical protein [Laspinema sp. D3a]MCT7992303.1 hypothetical protein [Laspinema sp. D3c]
MDDKKLQSEPLRRFISPEQLGLVAFVILFWVIVLHYTLERFGQVKDDCPVIDPQSSPSVRNIEGCVKEQ